PSRQHEKPKAMNSERHIATSHGDDRPAVYEQPLGGPVLFIGAAARGTSCVGRAPVRPALERSRGIGGGTPLRRARTHHPRYQRYAVHDRHAKQAEWVCMALWKPGVTIALGESVGAGYDNWPAIVARV